MSDGTRNRRRGGKELDIPIPVILGLGLIALTLSVTGWSLQFGTDGWRFGALPEALYLGLSVLTPSDVYALANLEEAGVERGTWAMFVLRIARWFGVLFFALSVIKVVMTWLYEGIVKRIGRRFFKDHVVVIGKSEFADRMAREAAETGVQIVQFEPDGKETIPDGILTMDINQPLAQMLDWSAAHRARAIILATGDNAESTDLAERLVFNPRLLDQARASNQKAAKGGTPKRLEPHVFVLTGDEWYERRDELNHRFHEPRHRPGCGAELDCVVEHVSESRAAARAVMTAEPVFRLQQGEIQHIVIVGFGAMGRAVLTEFCETQRVDPDRRPWVTIIEPDPSVWESFTQRVPEWEKAFDGAVFHSTINQLEGQLARFAWRMNTAPPAAIYVTTGSGIDSIAAAADVKHVLAQLIDDGALKDRRIRCPVFACARGGTERLDGRAAQKISQEDTNSVARRFPIIQFGSWPDVIDASRVLHDGPDQAAWRIHETHRKGFSKNAPEPWSNAEEFKRYSSRSAAAYVPALLHAAGFELGPWLAHTATHRPSTDRLPRLAEGQTLAEDASTLVMLARLEHARFCTERIFRGFRLGERDDDRKRHNELVPFDDLPFKSKKYNLNYINRLQDMLLETADGPIVARPIAARRPVMRPTDIALVRDAGIDPASLAPERPASDAPKNDPSPDPDGTELAHG